MRCARQPCKNAALASCKLFKEQHKFLITALDPGFKGAVQHLCGKHANRMTAPQGWELVREVKTFTPEDDTVWSADIGVSRDAEDAQDGMGNAHTFSSEPGDTAHGASGVSHDLPREPETSTSHDQAGASHSQMRELSNSARDIGSAREDDDIAATALLEAVSASPASAAREQEESLESEVSLQLVEGVRAGQPANSARDMPAKSTKSSTDSTEGEAQAESAEDVYAEFDDDLTVIMRQVGNDYSRPRDIPPEFQGAKRKNLIALRTGDTGVSLKKIKKSLQE